MVNAGTAKFLASASTFTLGELQKRSILKMSIRALLKILREHSIKGQIWVTDDWMCYFVYCVYHLGVFIIIKIAVESANPTN